MESGIFWPFQQDRMLAGGKIYTWGRKMMEKVENFGIFSVLKLSRDLTHCLEQGEKEGQRRRERDPCGLFPLL